MTALVGPLSIVCGVLAVAGLAKLAKPDPTRLALASLGVDPSALPVRLLGLFEVSLAAATIGWGGTFLPLTVGALHVGFASVVLALVRRPGSTSCGCFGSVATPAGVVHVVMNLASAAIAFAAIGAPGLIEVMSSQPAAGVPYAILVGTGVAAALGVVTMLPRLRLDTSAAAPAFAVGGSR